MKSFADYLFLTMIILLGFSLSSCQKERIDLPKNEEYTGPFLAVDSVNTLWSDSAVVRVKLLAAKQFEYESGNREFPEGVYIEFYEVDGTVSSTIKANKGYYFKAENKYRAEGDVVVNNIKKGEQLETEELFWKPEEERVYTDKFVTIRTEEELLMGDGLTAKQDFSTYKILKPRGDFLIDEDL